MCVYKWVRMCVRAPVYACVRARTRMQVVVGAFEYANTYTHTCIRAHIQCMRVCIYIHMPTN
jgi:hypothetical protein